MHTQHFSDEALIQHLVEAPEIRTQLESLLLAVTDEQGKLKEAESAELRIIEEVRQMGRVALSSWASHRVVQENEAQSETPAVWQEGKKN